MIRFIAALLFAIALLAVSYAGTWWFAANQVEKQILATLNELTNNQLEIATTARHFLPTQTEITLHDVTLPLPLDSTHTLTLRMGDMTIRNDLFGNYIISIELPREIKATLVTAQKDIDYQIFIERGRLTFYPQINGGELNLSAYNFALKPSDTSKPAFELKLGDSYAIINGRNGFKLSLQQAKINFNQHQPWWTFDLLSAEFLLPRHKTITQQLSGPLLAGNGPLLEQNWLNNLANLQPIERLMLLESFTFRNNDYQLSAQGLWGMDQKRQPTGDLRLVTNNLDATLNGLLSLELVNPKIIAESRWLERLIRRSGLSKQVRLHMSRGQLMFNNTPIGEVPPLNTLSARIFDTE